MQGTWKTTGGGPQVTAGGAAVVIVAVALVAAHRQIGAMAGEALGIIAAGVVAVLAVVVAIAIAMTRHTRRQGEALAVRRAEREAAHEKALEERRQAKALAAEQAQALPAVQLPQITNYIVTDPVTAAAVMRGQRAHPVTRTVPGEVTR